MGDHHNVPSDDGKEEKSPRFLAILRVTSGRRKGNPSEIKSFSHELNSKGLRDFPLRKIRGLSSPTDLMQIIQTKFERLKVDVDSELRIFAGDLLGLLEKSSDTQPEWRETLEDLLVVAQQCAQMPPSEFWLKCEEIVQNLDDRRQELPMGTLKQVHTRVLFILTRCTRLIQFQKAGALPGDDHVLQFHQFSDLGVYPDQGVRGRHGFKSFMSGKDMKQKLTRLSSSREQSNWNSSILSEGDNAVNVESPGSRNRMSSWKKFPSAAEKNQKKDHEANEPSLYPSLSLDKSRENLEENSQLNDLESPSKVLPGPLDPSAMEKIMSGNLGDPQNQVNENALMCRICDVKIPVVYLEDHSRICTVADRCDFKGLSVNERLDRVTETLHKIMESATLKSSDAAGVNIPEAAMLSSSSITDESDGLSPERSNLYRPCSEGMIDCLPEAVSSFLGNDIKGLENVSSNAHLVRAIAQGTTTSSSGSMTPRSPLLTPRTSQIDLLLAGSSTFWENENLSQIDDLLDVIRSIKNVNDDDYTSLQYLLSYLTDLQDIVEGKFLITGTFGRRAQKLLAEKYAHLCGEIDDDNMDNLRGMAEEVDVNMAHKSKSRKQGTSIEDFVIIKPISRGAFGRVFLAKKKTTDDLFAIKVLRKDDMIRKNAVESILAERDILISARNPFVVRFFYSFTCEENLYLVMEYLNGGDLYSLLRNLGCLEEEMARTYIAEVVLALEYLHSLNVVHRDLKPDNLLINHDGHIKLTDFGLSKVGLINSTDDLSGPDISCTAVVGDEQPIECAVQQKQKREQRQKQSAVGTPDYLAPEILLGMGHGPTADWWSVGIILFELLVGIPPFNAEHPQKIFDNIMNRDIPWPQIPEEMTYEAYDLIDKLLNENPIQRLGATGAGEVKQHAFFKNINWEKLGREKASFIPSADGAYDTSYFTCRHEWDSRDCQINHLVPNDDDDATDTCSASCSSGTQLYEDGDECGSLTDFMSPTLSVKYSFSNFSFKNLSQLALMNYEMIKGGKNSPSTSNPSLP